jgi:P-type Mg2+ transporter
LSQSGPSSRTGAERPIVGLSQEEARRRFAEFGPNEPVVGGRGRAFAQFVHFCSNPLVLILLVASALSALLGNLVDSTLIAAMVVLSIGLNFLQAFRSERAVEELRSQVAPSATVLRGGVWIELPRGQLVPGDIIKLSAGDLVPADARLLTSQDLHVQQAALTGESMPAQKHVSDASANARDPSDAGLVFLGTSIVSGSAIAEVVATDHARPSATSPRAWPAARPKPNSIAGPDNSGS